MIIRLLKAYTLNTGKKWPRGKVFRRARKEAAQMIEDKIAEEYNGPLRHTMRTKDKMKNLFKPTE